MDESARVQKEHPLGAYDRSLGCEPQYGVIGVTLNAEGERRGPPRPPPRWLAVLIPTAESSATPRALALGPNQREALVDEGSPIQSRARSPAVAGARKKSREFECRSAPHPTILCMKVRRIVIIENILITIPKKRLISGMGGQVK